MKLKQTKLYPYRLFLKNHALLALLPCDTLAAVWKEIDKNPLLSFTYPDSSGDIIECTVKSEAIQAVDRPFGTEPVSERAPVSNVKKPVSNRAQIRQGKIIIGQTAKRNK